MHSLAQEIQGFSKNRLKKQCTHVTTVTGRKLLERRSNGGEVEQVEELEEGSGCGFVEDKSLDLQIASQDAVHDIDTLQRYKVSHVLNVAYGVINLFPDQLVYKTLQILDLPETDITSYLGECSTFIDQAREQNGVVLVHCNAGVSRSSSIVIGYLMMREGLSFDEAYSQVKLARPSMHPNPGFYQQLQSYKPWITEQNYGAQAQGPKISRDP
ncbi:Dual specificity protein phosphatase 19 [Channa argus]|uniref:Dual specificity protein phosphatase 19 n=1 Tax=Channa argus TaxID=215402 RepID=A0A6G1QZQ5_CHAAH|nr:Dual specificity protein phosphatase 19 [Channa argus]